MGGPVGSLCVNVFSDQSSIHTDLLVRPQSSEDRGLCVEHPGESWLDPTNDTSVRRLSLLR